VIETSESLAKTSNSMVKELEYVIEDGLKFFGIVGWFVYCLSFCLQYLKPSDGIGADK
jgi:hypothetical protein